MSTDERKHGFPARLSGFWVSLPCRTGVGECNGMGGCACTCHDERDREAVRTAFRRGLTDVTPHVAGGDVTGPTTEETRDA